jgi:hypothetical protein
MDHGSLPAEPIAPCGSMVHKSEAKSRRYYWFLSFRNYWEDDKEVITSGKPKLGIIEPIDTATGTRWVQTDKIPYRDKEGRIIGIIGFAVDITERKQAEEERERLILELREALSQVKTLSGLLPICASCKKIRNDEGYWEQMEIYIRDHSEADFSHGICPECAQKLYPEYYKKK